MGVTTPTRWGTFSQTVRKIGRGFAERSGHRISVRSRCVGRPDADHSRGVAAATNLATSPPRDAGTSRRPSETRRPSYFCQSGGWGGTIGSNSLLFLSAPQLVQLSTPPLPCFTNVNLHSGVNYPQKALLLKWFTFAFRSMLCSQRSRVAVNLTVGVNYPRG